MNYLTRELVCQRLHLLKRQSYRIIRPTKSGLINSDSILYMLNRVRIGGEVLTCVPSDIMTAEEIAGATDISLDMVRKVSRRKRNPLPHYRINKQTTRYSLSQVKDWLKDNS